MKGAKETTLYDVDATGAVVKQAPPNDGVLNSIGKLGMTGENAAFDIVSDGNGGNEAWLMAGDNALRVDLATGKSVRVAKIAGINGQGVATSRPSPRRCSSATRAFGWGWGQGVDPRAKSADDGERGFPRHGRARPGHPRLLGRALQKSGEAS